MLPRLNRECYIAEMTNFRILIFVTTHTHTHIHNRSINLTVQPPRGILNNSNTITFNFITQKVLEKKILHYNILKSSKKYIIIRCKMQLY